MPNLNENYLKLQENYLFSEIAHRVAAYTKQNQGKNVIRLGIGDVTRPLCQCAGEALLEGAKEMMSADTFKGYGPEQGYEETRRAIADYYKKNGVELNLADIFISDGAKSDTGNITELFGKGNVILIPDPVYPVYVDSNIMCGNEVTYISGNAENDFLPLPNEKQHADIIYICSPNNPTGAVYNRTQLKEWVDYANEINAVILFDAAYEAFIEEKKIPHSIFEIEGADTCAIEICSLSKTAGFTGTRCGYTILPQKLVRGGMKLQQMWVRNRTTKTNGVSYIIQKGAAAIFSEEGTTHSREIIAVY